MRNQRGRCELPDERKVATIATDGNGNEVRAYITIDRQAAGWPSGPWDGEPDKVQWKDAATGMPCLAVRNWRGNWCGYAGVAPSHPLYGKDYNDRVPVPKDFGDRMIDDSTPILSLFREALREADGTVGIDMAIQVHGGITFADRCMPDADEATDICHVPAEGEPDHVWWFGFDCAHFQDASPSDGINGRMPPLFDGCVYRDFAYVKEQTEGMARQLAQFNCAPAALPAPTNNYDSEKGGEV